MSLEIPLSVMISEVELEIRMRENVYSGLVAKGKMKARDKERKIAIMLEVLKTLRELHASKEPDHVYAECTVFDGGQTSEES